MPAVSVIIPTFNRADMLGEALASVFAQTYRDFETIVVDDGSTDHTPDVVGQYAGAVQYIRQQNGGRSRARNLGLLHARGMYVAFLDDDDLWLPRKLELQAAVLDEHEDVDVVYGPLLCFSDKSTVRWVLNEMPPPPDMLFEELLLRDCIGNPSVIMIRKSTLDRIGYFDPLVEPCEDWELLIRIVFQGSRLEFIAEPLARYRLHGDNTNLARMHAGAVATLEKVLSASWMPDLLKARRRYFLSRTWVFTGKQWHVRANFAKAGLAWLEAMRLDPPSFTREVVSVLAKRYRGTRPFRLACRVKRLLLNSGISSAKAG